MARTNQGAASLRLEDFLPYRLSFTANLVSERIAGAYRELFDLGIPEWRVVAVVAEGNGITQQAIALATRMDKVTVSRATAALTRRGLLARDAHPGDGRSHRLSLTEAGVALYREVAPKALELERAIFAGFGREELEGFVAMLRRIDGVLL